MREPTNDEKKVFGANCVIGKDDKPIEQGSGSEAYNKRRNAKLAELAEKEAAMKRPDPTQAQIDAADDFDVSKL